VHRKNISIYIQQNASLHSLFYLETALHVLGGTITHHQEREHVSTASGICHTVTAICRYRGRVGTAEENNKLIYIVHLLGYFYC
jgi:hypothetical protein